MEARRAVIYRYFPTVIIIRDQDARDYDDLLTYRIKIDPGSVHTGIVIVCNETNRVMYSIQIEHRAAEITKLLQTRNFCRRNRRDRETPYRRSKWKDGNGNERTSAEGTLPPSIRSIEDNIIHIVKKLRKLAPVSGYDYAGNKTPLTDLAYVYDENGNKTDQVEDFFWKVLVDRRMYDNNGRYIEQLPVSLENITTSDVENFAKYNVGISYNKDISQAATSKLNPDYVIDNPAYKAENLRKQNQTLYSERDTRNPDIRYSSRGEVHDLTGVEPATREESLKLSITNDRNVARIRNEVTQVIDKTMPAAEMILYGTPPETLRQFLNSSNPLYMGQKAAKKAIYPLGENGGKHGLGRIVLDELAYQFNDPLAITGNTSDHVALGDNSIVVWTDWKTQNGDPIIVPIAIDANGNIGVYNSVNSAFDAYDENYVEDLLRSGNVIYTRKNKSINELLTQQREVLKRESVNASSNDTTTSPQESQEENKIFSERATMTEDRIDYLIKDSGAGSRKDYAQKWITSISPSDFLAMTLRRPSQVRETFDNMPSEYGSTVNNYDYIRALKDEMRQTPYLAVDVNTGKVVGHEGRHRMRALEKEGITNAEMVIEFRDKNGNLVKEKNGYGNPLEILDSLTIKNQYGTRQSATVQNVIPLNEANRENIIASYGNEDAQIRYSERNTGTGIASNRELLAGALESAAQTDIEKSMLERYQKNTKLMDNEQKRLDGIRAQIRELSFAKGPRQTDKINELRQTAKQIESKINAYDKKLLNLEAASPLKAVLERERNIITIIIVFSPPLIIQDLKTLDERNVI